MNSKIKDYLLLIIGFFLLGGGGIVAAFLALGGFGQKTIPNCGDENVQDVVTEIIRKIPQLSNSRIILSNFSTLEEKNNGKYKKCAALLQLNNQLSDAIRYEVIMSDDGKNFTVQLLRQD